MKVSRKQVIKSNMTAIRGFISGIRDGDTDDILDKRVGDRVSVVPDADQGNSGNEITVIFKVNAVMAVTKGADISEIASLINTITQGDFGALGTGMGAFGPMGTGMSAGAGIGGATLRTLKKIMSETQSSGQIPFQVKAYDIGGSPQNGAFIEVSSYLTGHVGTNDNDSDEIAIATNKAKILTKSGDPIISKNVGLSRVIAINDKISRATDEVKSDAVQTVADLSWTLNTDGAVTHDTVSMVQIGKLTMVLKKVEVV